jgi:hypothetical protein
MPASAVPAVRTGPGGLRAAARCAILAPVTLYVVHHGEAKPAGEDPARTLTARGRADTERLAALLCTFARQG